MPSYEENAAKRSNDMFEELKQNKGKLIQDNYKEDLLLFPVLWQMMTVNLYKKKSRLLKKGN